LETAELTAFNVFEPALRSRGAIRHDAKQLFESPDFQERIRSLFTEPPSGRLVLRNLQDAFTRIEALERRIEELERELKEE